MTTRTWLLAVTLLLLFLFGTATFALWRRGAPDAPSLAFEQPGASIEISPLASIAGAGEIQVPRAALLPAPGAASALDLDWMKPPELRDDVPQLPEPDSLLAGLLESDRGAPDRAPPPLQAHIPSATATAGVWHVELTESEREKASQDYGPGGRLALRAEAPSAAGLPGRPGGRKVLLSPPGYKNGSPPEAGTPERPLKLPTGHGLWSQTPPRPSR